MDVPTKVIARGSLYAVTVVAVLTVWLAAGAILSGIARTTLDVSSIAAVAAVVVALVALVEDRLSRGPSLQLRELTLTACDGAASELALLVRLANTGARDAANLRIFMLLFDEQFKIPPSGKLDPAPFAPLEAGYDNFTFSHTFTWNHAVNPYYLFLGLFYVDPLTGKHLERVVCREFTFSTGITEQVTRFLKKKTYATLNKVAMAHVRKKLHDSPVLA